MSRTPLSIIDKLSMSKYPYSPSLNIAWMYTRVEDKRNPKIERSYWLRAKFESQGLHNRVLSKVWKNFSDTNVTSLSLPNLSSSQYSSHFEKGNKKTVEP